MSKEKERSTNIVEKYIMEIYKMLEDDLKWFSPDTIHVTDLVGECEREVVLSKIYPRNPNLSSALYMADGKSKHLVVLGDSDKHELKLEVDGIRGAVDDYDEQNKLLIEKKTILSFKFLDKPRDEHIKQVLAYAYMLRKSGYEVDKAIIIYLLRTMEEMPKQFEVNINDYDLNSFWGEMMKKANTILKHIKDKTLPPRKISWYCNYCNYTDLCFTKGELA